MSLYEDSRSKAFTFKLMTYNVDQSVREEKVEATKWDVRAPRVKRLIEAVDADIVCLQEFRRLPGVAQTAEQFLASLGPTYRAVLEYRNPSPMAFGQAILYKPERFYPLQTRKFWLSPTPYMPSDGWTTEGRGYICTGVQFQAVTRNGQLDLGKPTFWVWNTHFGLEEKHKTKSCELLVAQLATPSEYPHPHDGILCGDLNLFPDLGAAAQRAIFTDADWIDMGKGARTLNGRALEGTFVGYEHDEKKADLNNMVSRLDHILATPGDRFSVGSDPLLYTRTMLPVEPPELTTRDYPSDHLPLVVHVNVQ
jgi:endonuclease/exonuclease/phosphatase family metal-dependent hydrolase